jgi:hypothetical protein
MNAVCDLEVGHTEMTVGDTLESIESALFRSQELLSHGQNDVAERTLKTAWREYLHFQDILRAYSGNEDFGPKLVAALCLLDNPLSIDNDATELISKRVLVGSAAA